MENMSLKEFSLALSSKEAVPGGGGASACAGAYGCSLGIMACALTHGKKKYACYEADIARIEEELGSCRDTLLACIDEDAKGFLPLSKAYGLPKGTEEQRREKERQMENALYGASLTPVRIIGQSLKAIRLMDELSSKCSRLVVSDVVTGAALLKAAVNGGLTNVLANTSLMKDRQKAEKIESSAKEMAKEAADATANIPSL